MISFNRAGESTDHHGDVGLQAAFDEANEALGGMRVIECALHAVAEEGIPIELETRQVVLCHAAGGLHSRIDKLEEALDAIEDFIAENRGGV